ncbi:MAG: DNA cytosine methyltransferase [Dysgonamonadaceae bacterium]|jgi:DNA (cytosine-5)-methyltransferase 1|nr:DNA cytosine methyltransferase [Dysgonamonadaceae bacterium]
MEKHQKKTYIDLFAGCGGLSLGLHNAGWEGLFAIEKSPQAFKTLEFNLIEKINHFKWPEWFPKQAHDINTVITQYTGKLQELRGKVTLVAGGPPCQGFSIAGQRNEDDERNKLIESYIKFVSLVKPDLIFFENVKGFTMGFRNNAAKGKKYSQVVTSKLTEEGYSVYGQLVNFGDYGVPQKRTRFILVGIRNDIKGASVEKAKSFFLKLEENKFNFLQQKDIPISPTVEDALSDLIFSNGVVDTPDRKGFKSGLYKTAASKYQCFVREETKNQPFPNSHSFARQTSKVVSRLQYIQSVTHECKDIGEDLKNKLGITTQVLIPLQPKEQSPTVTSHPDDLIHYCEPRILTVRECARLQGFPDDFEFQAKYTTGGKHRKYEVPRYTQVGNAIPPLFGEQAGLTLDWLRYG